MSFHIHLFQLAQQRDDYHLAVTLFAKQHIATQNKSNNVNVVREGSASRMWRVLLISLGITIRPRSSTRLTMPVAFIVLQCGTAHRPFPTIIFQFAPLIVSSRTPRHSRGLLFTAKKRFRTYAKPLSCCQIVNWDSLSFIQSPICR